jgi:ubiquinone biosynthesis protein UbiJ
MLQQPAVATLNHLLAQSGWALPRLAMFSGRTLRFELPLFSLTCTIQHDGLLQPAAADASADVAFAVPPALLPRLALLDDAALELIPHSGDAALTEEVFFLARNLRWDAAEDLSRITGDIAAERIVRFAEGAQSQLRRNVLNLSQALAEYWTEERPLIASTRPIAAFSDGVKKLQNALTALEQRIDRLSKAD